MRNLTIVYPDYEIILKWTDENITIIYSPDHGIRLKWTDVLKWKDENIIINYPSSDHEIILKRTFILNLKLMDDDETKDFKIFVT